MKEKYTISDVAARAGVSKSTISNYLNGRFHVMSEETRQKIGQIIQELDYVPALSAQRLSSKSKARTICLIAYDLHFDYGYENHIVGQTITTVGRLARKNNYHTIMYLRDDKTVKREMEYLKGMAHSFAEGFICFDLKESDELFQYFEKENIPYICIGKIAGYDNYKYIASDHGGDTKRALEYCYGMGHRNVCLITESSRSATGEIRKIEYDRFIEKYGLDYYYLLEHAYSQDEIWEDGINLLGGMWFSGKRPTALVLTFQALKMVEVFLERFRISIPEDLSVVLLNATYPVKSKYKYTCGISRINEVVEEAFYTLEKIIDEKDYPFESKLLKLGFDPGETIKKIN